MPELKHHGILGMKWGVRKDNKHTNPNYTDQQRKRDREIYGSRGVSRINKAMNNGDTISVARGTEKTKRDHVLGRQKYVRQGGKIVGASVGAIGSQIGISALISAANTRVGNELASKLLGKHSQVVLSALDSGGVRATAAIGMAKVGEMLAGDAAVGVSLRLHGYNPNRRY